ncbi:MAG TPA: efflux RND transporter permease subunit [Fimbriiglobus sp.]|jgi:multidrug efflux pump subunit AcrB
MWIVLLALSRPYTVWVGMLLVTLLGTVSYLRTPTDILPTMKTPVVVVFASYRGMPAPEMEQSVVAVLERSLTKCDRLRYIESRSLLGIGMIRIYFRPDVDPDVAASQVAAQVSAEMQNMPPGMQLPTIFKFDASAIPVGQLVVRSDRADDKELLDLADTRIRDELAGIEGLASAPVFGGTFRQVQIYVDPRALEAYRLTTADVAKIVNAQSQVLPTGEIRIDARTFYLSSNSMARTLEEFEQIPLWTDGRKVVRLRDVARVEDGQRWRTNVVRAEGRRAVYMPLLRQGGASAVTVVDNVREFLPKLHERGAIPDDVEVELVFDQSQYVREAMGNLRFEAGAGAVLASLVVLLFLSSLRATAIVGLSIPLSVLAALIGLYVTGHTLNIMTLGGLALVLGRVIDDCIVDIENTSRHLGMGKPSLRAATDSAREISLPVLMATVSTMIVFAPVMLMEGMGKYLFTPLAVAACLAMAASYVVARTVSPLCCSLFLKPHGYEERLPRWLRLASGIVLFLAGGALLVATRRPVWAADWPLWLLAALPLITAGAGVAFAVVVLSRLARKFDRWYERRADRYLAVLTWVLRRRWVVGLFVVASALPAVWAYRHTGKELFPDVDTGEFTIHLRAVGGPRVEETERMVAEIEQIASDVIPDIDLDLILSNAGLSSRWSAIYTPNNGPHAAFVRVQLRSGFAGRSTPTSNYVEKIRLRLAERFPDHTFFFETGGMIRRILNGGATAPIEIQVSGRDNVARRAFGDMLTQKVATIPAVQDTYRPQSIDLPQVRIKVDRDRAALLGLTESDVIRNVVMALMSSAQLAPNIWIDPKSGNPYVIGVQYPEHLVRDLHTLEDIPIAPERGFGPGRGSGPLPRTLKDVATIVPAQDPVEVFHSKLTRVSQIYVGVAGDDIAGVAADVERIVGELTIPKGLRVEVLGEVPSMRSSFREMAFALILAVVLVYLLLTAQFSSWVDPLIVVASAPLGLVGVAVILWVTGSSLNIQSCMGVLMLVGISVSNAVLLVKFANEQREAGHPTREAILLAARTRLRPILMTTLATIGGLLPLAVHLHPGDEMNLPLARAVIGGMLSSMVLTLFVIPALYTLFKPSGPAVPADMIELTPARPEEA